MNTPTTPAQPIPAPAPTPARTVYEAIAEMWERVETTKALVNAHWNALNADPLSPGREHSLRELSRAQRALNRRRAALARLTDYAYDSRAENPALWERYSALVSVARRKGRPGGR